MDAAKLACKLIELIESESWALLYNVECDTEDWRPYGAYLWLTNSGCTLTRDMECAISDITGKLTNTGATLTDTTSCNITVTEVTSTFSCPIVIITEVSDT